MKIIRKKYFTFEQNILSNNCCCFFERPTNLPTYDLLVFNDEYNRINLIHNFYGI